MASVEEKKKVIAILIKNNILTEPELLKRLDDDNLIKKLLSAEDAGEEAIRRMLSAQEKSTVRIIKSYKEDAKKRSAEDFTTYFNIRYNKLKEIIQKKQEMQEAISIKRALSKAEKEKIVIIGMIYEKGITKNSNIMLTLEDPTGRIKVVVNKNRAEAFRIAEDCVCDEVIGMSGVCSKNIAFVDNILLPEIPPTNELKKGPEEIYAIFTGDHHVGAKQFLHDKFENFIKWLNGKAGSEEQKEIAKKAKYLFLVGDLVDGIGIHPHQFEELDIKDIEGQYAALAEQLKKIPDHIQIIICAGNHDALRLIEPQPQLYEDYAKELYALPNVHIVSNPALVNIAATGTFSGFNVLLYHGFSFHFYSEHVESISRQGGSKRADLIMQFLLQRRHLAPEHTSVTSVPKTDEDPLLIDVVPDFFVSGHIHRATAALYRNVTTLNCSCWIGMTPFQEKVGLIPEPARAFAVNLKTRDTKVIRF